MYIFDIIIYNPYTIYAITHLYPGVRIHFKMLPSNFLNRDYNSHNVRKNAETQ